MNYLFDVFGVLWNIESPFELHVSFGARVAVIDLLLIFDNLHACPIFATEINLIISANLRSARHRKLFFMSPTKPRPDSMSYF